jgi:hypothetical protein
MPPHAEVPFCRIPILKALALSTAPEAAVCRALHALRESRRFCLSALARGRRRNLESGFYGKVLQVSDAPQPVGARQ